jgi:biopolymer transport protein ExbB
VAEALIATMCGLGIAVTCLFPYNILNARTEQAKQEIADASHALEILIKKFRETPTDPASKPYHGRSSSGQSGGRRRRASRSSP